MLLKYVLHIALKVYESNSIFTMAVTLFTYFFIICSSCFSGNIIKLEFCIKFWICFHRLSHFILPNYCEIFRRTIQPTHFKRFLAQCNLSLTALEYSSVDQLLEDDWKTAHFENRPVVGSGGKSQMSGLAIADVACLNNRSLGCGCQNCSSIKTLLSNVKLSAAIKGLSLKKTPVMRIASRWYINCFLNSQYSLML